MRFKVEKREQLAHFLQQRLGVSGKKIRKLLEMNCCKVNSRFERFGSRWLEVGQVVEFFVKEEEPSSFTVLFDHDLFAVLDKPTNWVCSEDNCLKTFKGRYYLVHRLDKDTTGALLVAKSPQVRDELMSLFASREVDKSYIAIVDKVVSKDEGVCDNYLARKGSYQGQTIWGSASKGDRAITHWKVLARSENETLMLCKPVTGRTHQIRVHMSELGHPLLVDRQYSKYFHSKILAHRPLLHAYRLSFSYQGVLVDVSAPIPVDFSTVCTRLNFKIEI